MSFQSGLSGLNAAAKNLDAIGNNVANSNTVGFKGSTAQFADLYANAAGGSGGITIGIGTQLSKVAQQFTQGNITITGSPLDMAINGGGFFRMSHGGIINYTRDGQFSLDKDGYLVNAATDRLTGYRANSNGTLDTSAPGDLQISSSDIPPAVTTEVQAQVNLDSRLSALDWTAFSPSNSATYNSATSVSVYDTLGNQHALSMYFVKCDDTTNYPVNTWWVMGALDGTMLNPDTAVTGPPQQYDPIAVLVFDGSTGGLDLTATDAAVSTAATVAGGSITGLVYPFTPSATLTNGADSPLDFTLDFTGTTQYGAPFAANGLTQDGYAPGRLSGYNVGGDGTILGRYSNGQSKTLGQVVLANFPNPNGLNSLGGNSWAESIDSGQPLVGVPGAGKLGQIQAGAVEDSNVDVTAELVKMITAQRIYQSNAQTIKTQDNVLQTLVNMR